MIEFLSGNFYLLSMLHCTAKFVSPALHPDVLIIYILYNIIFIIISCSLNFNDLTNLSEQEFTH